MPARAVAGRDGVRPACPVEDGMGAELQVEPAWWKASVEDARIPLGRIGVACAPGLPT